MPFGYTFLSTVGSVCSSGCTNTVPVRVLGIETSGDPLSVALVADGQLQGLFLLGEPHVHDRMAAELIRRLLEDCGLELAQLDAVAISAGPGSFTGLRIGASLAKGLCLDAPPALVAVPTLEALAAQAVPLAALLGLRRILACVPSHVTPTAHGAEGWLFIQHFSATGIPESDIERRAIGDIPPDPNTLLCGPGALWVEGVRAPFLDRLSAEWIARAGLERYRRGIVTTAEEFVPLYGMEFQPRPR